MVRTVEFYMIVKVGLILFVAEGIADGANDL